MFRRTIVIALVALAAAGLVFAAATQAAEEDNEDKAEEITPRDLDVEQYEEIAERAPGDVLGPPHLERTAPGVANVLGDRYWYLPYAVTNEKMGLAFLEAYADVLAEGERPPESLEVPEGYGAGGGSRIYRLQRGVTDMFIRDINNPAATAVTTSQIPVMIAQPGPGADGANVLFMDGHIEFVPMGEFPVTQKFLKGLRELDPPEWTEEEEEMEEGS
jgi:prepilin-type processing-associated H-X9-DG protein